MRLNKLSDFNKVLFLKLSVTFVTIFFIAVIIFGFLFIQSYKNEVNFQNKQLTSANQLFQSNLSGKIKIIANSKTFTDYLRSGTISRQYMDIDFETEMLPLKSQRAIKGMAIHSIQDGFLIYKTGKKSNQKINLKLCYLNSRLSRYGECRYVWTLYLSKNDYIDQLKRINHDISACNNRSCIKKNLLVGQSFGSFKTTGESNLFFKFQKNQPKIVEAFSVSALILLLLLIFFASWIYRSFSSLISKSLTKPLAKLVKNLQKDIEIKSESFNIEEIKILSKQIKNWRCKFLEYKKHEQQLAIGKLAAQVAHDIRSPLAALEILSKHLDNLPEKQKLIIKNVIQRINQIANELLLTHRSTNKKKWISSQEITLIYTLINSIILEKQIQLEKENILLSSHFGEDCYNKFVKIDAAKLKRVLSNLLNNAAETSCKHSNIDITISCNNNQLAIEVTDYGKGIAVDILPHIFEKGVTNKYDGSGLGLYYAKRTIEQFGGKINVSSKLGYGSTFKVQLPITETPDWFASSINLRPETIIAILDDSETIHQAWDMRFKEFEKLHHINLEIKHFSRSQELINWYKTKILEVILLVDYDLSGEEKTGLDVILEIENTKNSILVTSYAEEPDVIKQCQKNNVKLIPKDFAPHVSFKCIY